MAKTGIQHLVNGDIDALLALHHATFGDARMEGEGDGGGGGTGGGAGGGGGAGTGGAGSGDADTFPANTPLSEMTPQQQVAYWKHHARKHESTIKELGDIDNLKDKASKYDKHVADSASEQERAVQQAVEQATTTVRQQERQRTGGKLVQAEVRATAAGRLGDAQLTTLLENLDTSKFLTSDGDVDSTKVATLVDGLAPKKDNGGGGGGGTGRTGAPNHGQGQRAGQQTERGSAGRAEAQRRFGKDKQ